MKSPQEQSCPADQGPNDGQQATGKTTEHTWSCPARGFPAGYMGCWQRLQTADGHGRIGFPTHTHRPEGGHRDCSPKTFGTTRVLHFRLVPLPPATLPIFEASFDGLVTNDKFCLSRSAHLQLSHWRLALSQRLSGTAPSVYPLTQLVGSGGIDEAAPVDRSSPVPGNPRRPTSVGPRLSAVTAVGSRINRSSE